MLNAVHVVPRQVDRITCAKAEQVPIGTTLPEIRPRLEIDCRMFATSAHLSSRDEGVFTQVMPAERRRKAKARDLVQGT